MLAICYEISEEAVRATSVIIVLRLFLELLLLLLSYTYIYCCYYDIMDINIITKSIIKLVKTL